MSVSNSRRTREIGAGVTGKIAAASGKINSVYGKSVSAGKENARPTSRIRGATQKPVVQPMARIDKLAAAGVESRAETQARKSTSSVPRGRSSSPAEFTRIFSESGKTSKVSGRPQSKSSISKSTEKIGQNNNSERRVSRDFAKIGRTSDVTGGVSLENEKVRVTVATRGAVAKKDGSFGTIMVKNVDLDKNVPPNSWNNAKTLDHLSNSQPRAEPRVNVGSCNFGDKEVRLSSTPMKKPAFEATYSSLSTKTRESLEPNVGHSGVGVDRRSTDPKLVNKVSNSTKEIGPNKSATKLHQKLAFLEGKVKKIASDIKKTKEMLDMNNPDTSKLILSGILNEISGIESAMCHVIENDGDSKRGLNKTIEIEKKHDMDAMDANGQVKGPNVEELEARLFPHHKLIRDRIQLKSALIDSNANPNAIALECLPSLNENEPIGPEATEVQEMDEAMTSADKSSSLNVFSGKDHVDVLLMSEENLNEFDDQDKQPDMVIEEVDEDQSKSQLNDIGSKSSTGGWFVSEGESVLLAHDDGSCSFYDIANSEEKAEYKPPPCITPYMWRDCWIIRAPGPDGCSGKYVVAASAGNSGDSGFCSWDFYTKDIRASHFECETARLRAALAPLPNNTTYRRNSLSMAVENRQWWYKPCGPLIASTGSCRKVVQVYDIRDGEQVMTWELQKPVVAMDYSSPLHWRNRGKIVLAESDSISLWDVSSLTSQALLSVSSLRKISALHVNNTDAELGGGVRQRTTSQEAEGNDGIFCTSDSINVLDFRHPSGIGLKLPRVGVNMHSVFSRGDSIYVGCTDLTSSAKKHSSSSQIHQFSLRKQKLVSTYALPELNAHHNLTSLSQVWGNSSYVMGVCGLGLFIFGSLQDDDDPMGLVTTQSVKEVIGPDNMDSPSFDYCSSRVLIISRDRPASWRYLL